ncbi:MAG: PAS domain S-box protein [Lentisphaerae bacterium]|nr:PAS domain S-box protein [Lentisphaerota bacterium]
MHTAQSDRRNLVVVTVAIVIAFLLIVLNLSVQFSDRLFDFLASMSRFPPATGLINFLFIWLAFLLWLALRRWREVAGVKSDLEAIVSSISPDTLLIVNPDRTIRMCNDSVERIFGRKPGEVLNQKTDILYFDRRTNQTRPREIYDVLARNGFHYGVATGKHKNGGTVPLEIISGELVGQNGAVLLVRDITERQAFEEQRRRMEARALQTQKLESLGVLAGGVAHDFNNLLMIIQGHADLMMLREPVDPQFRDSIREIQKGANRARDICRHLLSFAGRAPRDVRSVNLSKVAEDASNLLALRIPAKVSVELNLAATLAPIEADESQLHQVALNLITNACDAIGELTGRIVVSTGEMDCGADYLTDTVGISGPVPGRYGFLRVTDTGCGMDEATRRRICEPFFTTKKDGNGMGMAAVLGIVRSHHGVIKVESVMGKGSTFTALFPVQAVPAVQPASEVAVPGVLMDERP